MLHILFRVAPLGIALSALIIVTLSLVLPARTVVVYVGSDASTDAGQRTFRHRPPVGGLMEIGKKGGAAAGLGRCETSEQVFPGPSWI